MPYGAGLAVTFLEVMGLLALWPLTFVGLICLFSLGGFDRPHEPWPTVLVSLSLFGVFELFFAMALIMGWLAKHLRAVHSQGGAAAPCIWRAVGMPVVATAWCYFSLATMMWGMSRVFNPTPFPWVLLPFWASAAVGCFLVWRWMDGKFPR